MSDMERKPSFKDRALEKLGIGMLRQKTSDSHVTSDTRDSGNESSFQNGQTLPPLTISVMEDFKPISLKTTTITDVPQISEKRKARPKPIGTIDYKVEVSDTLQSIAAHFDTTPSELAKLNKLPSSRMIFPGQILYVPDPDYDSGSEMSVSPPLLSPPNPSPPVDNKPRMDVPIVKMADRPPARVPGHVERQTSTSSQPDPDEVRPRKLSEDEAATLDRECYERFIKVNVKHITDGQGVISGVLLVTPNAIMFDPNVSDPLVIEQGPEMYGMIAPMDTVISAAMYHDIAAMKLKGQPEERASSPRPEVYHAKDCPMFNDPVNGHVEKKCYMGESLLQTDEPKGSRSSTVNSDLSETGNGCSCGAGAKEIDQSDTNICVKVADHLQSSNQSDSSITTCMANFVDASQSGISCVQADQSEFEKRTSDSLEISDVEKVPLEMGFSQSPESSDVKASMQVTAQGENLTKDLTNAESSGSDSRGIEIVYDRNENIGPGQYAAEEESMVRRLQENLKPLESETDEAATDSSGTGTLIDVSGDGMPFSSTANHSMSTVESLLGADSGNDSADIHIIETRASNTADEPEVSLHTVEDPSHISAQVPDPVRSSPIRNEGPAGFVPPSPMTPDMQIGNIKYFKYADPDEGASLINQDGEMVLQRPPSKSEPIPMPVTSKGEITESKSASSFGSFTGSPHISAFVNYATGLFRNTVDDHKLVKDITEDPTSETSINNNVGQGNETEKGIPEQENSGKHMGIENAVKIQDMPALFQSLDELVPRPAARYEDPPLYLCLRVGKPVNRTAYSTGPIESYGRKKKKPEYWFSIPRDKVDQLYAFFVQWSPDKYGDEDYIDAAARGFVVIDEDDPDVTEDEALDIFDEYFGPSSSQRIHRDWEIVNRDEFRRRSIDVYEPLPLPELIGESAILNEVYVSQLSHVLPGRAVGYPWTLTYSTDKHGFSLKTLYRDMYGLEGPILLVVKDTGNNVFGALVSCPLKISEHFYGTGESFLYTFTPDFNVYKWTGENNFFIKGNKDCLAIGAGQGMFGLWFDEDLYHGRSKRCETYDNDVLTETEDFVLKGLEAWAFIV